MTGVQRWQVVPLILEAEQYEQPAQAEHAAGHSHDEGHDHEAWAPEDGWERTLWTAIANIGTAIGFGLLLVAAYSLRAKVSVAQGVLWGLAGYVAFFVATALANAVFWVVLGASSAFAFRKLA